MKNLTETPSTKTKFMPTIPAGMLEPYHTADLAERNNAAEVLRLADKIKTLTTAKPTLQNAVEHAAEAKADILAKHAIDQATAEELNSARACYDAAVKSLSEASELLTAVEKAHRTATGKISQLQSHKNQIRNKVWTEVHKQVVAEIRAVAGDLFLTADVVVKRLGAIGQNNPFGPGVSVSQFQERVKHLEAEIFGR